MRTRWTVLFAASALTALSAGASAAENGLLGIRLFDSGVKVVTMYGSPDEIQPVNIGAMGGGGGGGPAGGGAGPAGPGAPPGRGGMGAPGGGGGGGPTAPDFSFGDFLLRQGGSQGGVGLAPAPPSGGGPGGPPMGGGGGAPGRMGGGGAPSGGGASAENATYTRWVYNRSGSKYGFIIDKNGRVVQIEAIGLSNSRVRTSKGITFGNTFAQVVKKYQTPDGYDISGSNVLARFLNKQKVAFRFARLGPNKPQVVTGIVVAAGKG